MTLAVNSPFELNPTQVESDHFCGECVGRENVERQRRGSAKSSGDRPSFNAYECEALLEEPAIALWAVEAATKYDVTMVDALELLAYALFLDGEM